MSGGIAGCRSRELMSFCSVQLSGFLPLLITLGGETCLHSHVMRVWLLYELDVIFFPFQGKPWVLWPRITLDWQWSPLSCITSLNYSAWMRLLVSCSAWYIVRLCVFLHVSFFFFLNKCCFPLSDQCMSTYWGRGWVSLLVSTLHDGRIVERHSLRL